ncbi:MAG: hypothetical protein U0869_22275 [Chloroflexota bacterium]
MSRPLRRLLGASLGVVLLLGIVAPGALALPATPNTSFVAYHPPTRTASARLVLGTLSGGVYTRTKTVKSGRWTNIAIGRDTMALYDKGTGKLTTGKLRAGVWKPLATTTVRKGYTDVVASCDTILFYRRSTGVGLVAELTSGGMRDKQNVALTPGITLLQASCDTLLGITPGGTSVWTLGACSRTAYLAASLPESYLASPTTGWPQTPTPSWRSPRTGRLRSSGSGASSRPAPACTRGVPRASASGGSSRARRTRSCSISPRTGRPSSAG